MTTFVNLCFITFPTVNSGMYPMYKGDIFKGCSFHTENVKKYFPSVKITDNYTVIRHMYCTKRLKFEKNNTLNRML